MQHDMFEPVEIAHLKGLEERKDKLKDELIQVERELFLSARIERERSLPIGRDLYLTPKKTPHGLVSGLWFLCRLKPNSSLEYIGSVSIDLLRKALDKVGGDTTHGPKDLSRTDGSGPAEGRW